MPWDLPIFELPLVLLPGERVPLHIFEERYKRMIDTSLDSGEPFGIVLRDSEGARPIGCTAQVTEVLERFDDGRLNIVVAGEDPFRVLDRFDDPEFPSAEVEMLDPGPGGADPDAAVAAREAFRDLAERAGGDRLATTELTGEDAYALAARVELPAETKQELLELRDEGKRMRLLARVLQALQQALDRADEIATRASSNGKVRIR
jgi:Lon protease-like protein